VRFVLQFPDGFTDPLPPRVTLREALDISRDCAANGEVVRFRQVVEEIAQICVGSSGEGAQLHRVRTQPGIRCDGGGQDPRRCADAQRGFDAVTTPPHKPSSWVAFDLEACWIALTS